MSFFTLERQIRRLDIKLGEDEARLAAARARREIAASKITGFIGDLVVQRREGIVDFDRRRIRVVEQHRQGVERSTGIEIVSSQRLDDIADLSPASRQVYEAESGATD